MNLPSDEITSLREALSAIRTDMASASEQASPRLDTVHPHFRASGRNLLHYLALRRHDMRALQRRLAAMGLSSLGRAESNVLASVDAVLHVLHRLSDSQWTAEAPPEVIDFDRGKELLREHTDALLGPPSPGRAVRIMVTMPPDAATDYVFVHNLLLQGMDCMRINCAHDDAAVWLRMIEHLRRAERALGRGCRVVMDLAGPKLRTGPLSPGPRVLRVRPRRDVYGHVTEPARLWFTGADSPQDAPSPSDAHLPVDAKWLEQLRVGDRVQFVDARGSRRRATVMEVTDRGCWAESRRTAYIVPGTVLRRKRAGSHGERETTVDVVTPRETTITLHQNDLLVLTRDLVPGRPATFDSAGILLSCAEIGCTIPRVFDDARVGEAIWIDDGKIGGRIEAIEPTRVRVRITQARVGGERLRGDKGINLPESALQLPALTEQDLRDLAFVAQHADVVELSFANSAVDVEALQRQLEILGSHQPAIVLKIETRRGFENLPDMLLTAMRAPSCGVMIARGDLAVECGFERLAEVQEEILWVCEAAHVPVIWATQVLESLAKDGMPSRAEITDAAMADRAECVMLNKGPHIVLAVRVLDDILRRMQAHHDKKREMLRELQLAHGLEEEAASPPFGPES